MQDARLARVRVAASAGLIAAISVLTGCQAGLEAVDTAERIKSDPKERFTEAEYGVKASPRVTDLKKVRKGGGREQVGRPYKVKGKWYYPKEQPGYVKVGNASWYGSSFHGRLTANGEVYDMFGLSAAHPTFPLPSYARVTNTETGSSVVVRVNDRGPYVADRMMDLSSQAAEMIGYKSDGVGRVKVEYVGKAPLEGDDTPVLMASFKPGNAGPSANDGLASGVMLAMNDEAASSPASILSVQPVLAPASASTATTGSTDAVIDAIIRNADTREASNVPTPRLRRWDPVASSYAPQEDGRTGARGALARLVGRPAVRIEIGTIADDATLVKVRATLQKRGRLAVEADETGRVAYAAVLPPGADADGVLQALWQAGATDAFALRD